MKEEWNKGYEKGRDDYCCNGDCNQGRNCPLRIKTLTDEEIDNLIMDVAEKPTNEDLFDFARAILKKAQEK
jgi:hypothetical protein